MSSSLLLRRIKKSNRQSYGVFAAPAVFIVIVFYIFPIIVNSGLAFTDWNAFKSDIDFSGLDNFKTLFDQSSILRQIQLTLIYATTAAAVSNFLSLPIALALEKQSKSNNFFRAVFFIPVLLSPLAAGYVWSGILDLAGPLSMSLNSIFGIAPQSFLGNPTWAIFLVAAVDGWKWCGFFTLIYIAALSTVPVELKEAAKTDGVNSLQLFRYVKLPFLAPAFTYNITVTLIGAISAFDIIVSMTGGGPGSSTRVLNVLTSDQFGAGYFGLSSATSLIVSILVLVISVPLIRWLRSRELEA
jgi:multiple sugar transport system permease protein/raffinose/stachyose/melibiose transport system permease protein